MNNTSFESYVTEGCGRCDKFQTPECKVHRWRECLEALREVLRETELVEQMRWGSPCYALEGKNVVMLTSLKESCALSFFKGAVLEDEHGVLEAPGPSSRHMRYMKFRSPDEVNASRELARTMIDRAIAATRAGVTVPPAEPEPMPDELADRLAHDAELADAFDALTPGRKRSHILHVGRAKQSATRARRVEACAQKILAGKGYNER